MSRTLRALVIGLVLLCGGTAQAGEHGWVPPPPTSPAPPMVSLTEPPTLAQRRVNGAINLLWSKGIQTAYLSMMTTHVIAEATGRNATKLVFPETPIMAGHVAVFLAGPWGYALAIDDGRPHRRHLGLAIGLFEQSAYAALVGGLNVLTRYLFYDVNGCHIPDPRGCIDHFYRPSSTPQGVIMLATAPVMFGFGVLHAVAAARLKKLEADGVMDGPEGDPYRAVYELPPKPEAMLIPTVGGVALVGRF
jgi:hypothetical protein